MTKRVNKLEDLGEIINSGEPAEVLYDLGEGRDRTELLLTYTDGSNKVTDRIASSPLIQLCKANGGISIDITDSDKNADKYSYRGLRPTGAVFEPPTHPQYELGDLVIGLEKGKELALSQYYRAE